MPLPFRRKNKKNNPSSSRNKRRDGIRNNKHSSPAKRMTREGGADITNNNSPKASYSAAANSSSKKSSSKYSHNEKIIAMEDERTACTSANNTPLSSSSNLSPAHTSSSTLTELNEIVNFDDTARDDDGNTKSSVSNEIQSPFVTMDSSSSSNNSDVGVSGNTKDGDNGSEGDEDDNEEEEEDKDGTHFIPGASLKRNDNNGHQLGQSMHTWVTDMNELVSSNVFQNAIHSTMSLATVVSKSMIQVTLYPLVKPIQITTTMIQSSMIFLHQSTLSLTNNFLRQQHSVGSRFPTRNERYSHFDHDQQQQHSKERNRTLANPAVHTLYQTTQEIINSTLTLLFGHPSFRQNHIQSTTSTNTTVGYPFQLMKESDKDDDSGDYVPLVFEDNDDKKEDHEYAQHADISVKDCNIDNKTYTARIIQNEDRKVKAQCNNNIDVGDTIMKECCSSSSLKEPDSMLFCILVSDLDVTNSKTFLNEEKSEEKKEENNITNATTSCSGSTEKIIVLKMKLPSSLVNDLNARANIINTMNRMIELGLNLAFNRIGEMSWQEEGSTTKLLKRIKNNLSKDEQLWYENSHSINTMENEVLLWSGSRQTTSSSYAPNVPMFRGRGVFSSIGPQELTELLLDSSKVSVYNKYSKGRKDLAVFQDNIDTADGLYGNGSLKIVESETKVPLSNNSIKMVTLMHARPIDLDGECFATFGSSLESQNAYENGRRGYIMISRTVSKVVGRMKGNDINKIDMKTCSDIPNNIIWGVNLLLEVPMHAGKTEMVSLTQAKSSAVPNFLVNKVGLLGAGDFFKNIRNISRNE